MNTKNEGQAQTVNEQNTGIDISYTMQQNNLHVELHKGEPIFLAKDVCEILGIANSRDALSSLDEDEKLVSVVATSGQRREMNFVTESGLYSLIFQSRKPEAKKFRKWVTAEVLPSIRKTGTYSTVPKPGVSIADNISNILQYCQHYEHDGTTWYAAIQVRAMFGKARNGSTSKLLLNLLEKGTAIKLPPNSAAAKWYVKQEAIADILNIKPTNFINVSILKALAEQKGGSYV